MPFFSPRKQRKPSVTSAQLKGLIGTSSLSERTTLGAYGKQQSRRFKRHLTKVVGNSKLDFEEMSTVLAQIEACLNSRPLGTIPHNDDDGIEMWTPGHFIIGRPLQAIPDHPHSSQPIGLLKRWYLCQGLVMHFRERWRNEYIVALRSYSKWRRPSANSQVGDVVVVKEDNLVASHWLIARIVKTNAGTNKLVRVVTLKTKDGTYKHPVTKLALLLPCEE